MSEPIPVDIAPRLLAAAERAMYEFHEATGELAVLRVILPPHALPYGVGEAMVRGLHGECALIDACCFEELRAETDARLREVPP